MSVNDPTSVYDFDIVFDQPVLNKDSSDGRPTVQSLATWLTDTFSYCNQPNIADRTALDRDLDIAEVLLNELYAPGAQDLPQNPLLRTHFHCIKACLIEPEKDYDTLKFHIRKAVELCPDAMHYCRLWAGNLGAACAVCNVCPEYTEKHIETIELFFDSSWSWDEGEPKPNTDAGWAFGMIQYCRSTSHKMRGQVTSMFHYWAKAVEYLTSDIDVRLCYVEELVKHGWFLEAAHALQATSDDALQENHNLGVACHNYLNHCLANPELVSLLPAECIKRYVVLLSQIGRMVDTPFSVQRKLKDGAEEPPWCWPVL